MFFKVHFLTFRKMIFWVMYMVFFMPCFAFVHKLCLNLLLTETTIVLSFTSLTIIPDKVLAGIYNYYLVYFKLFIFVIILANSFLLFLI